MDLTNEVNKILKLYTDECERAVLEVEESIAKEAVKKLNKTSPKNASSGGRHGKHYANDWVVDNRSKKHYAHIIIKNNQYQLTHLLENGHEIVRNGQVVGHASKHPHIKPVEEWCKDETVRRLELYLGAKRRVNATLIFNDEGGNG